MPLEDRAATAATAQGGRAPRSLFAPGMGRRGIEILARSIYRELCERGCQGNDVIRLATALLDQIIDRKAEQRAQDASPACAPSTARLLPGIAGEDAA